METWLDINGFEGIYQVSDEGRVLSLERRVPHVRLGIRLVHGRTLRATPDKDGYLNVVLSAGGVKVPSSVHRLVLWAFVGPCPPGKEGCHCDGDPTNNRVGNLRWDTPGGNQADRVAHGTILCGERCGNAKLTESAVRLAFILRAAGWTHRKIGAELGVAASNVSMILSGDTWAHLGLSA
jgi:NUMOD4 motif/HNH endonuclease